MGYTTDESMVEVNFFTRHGKWYCTEAVKWLTWTPTYLDNQKQEDGKDIYEAFIEALQNHFKDNPNRLSSMVAVCLNPYHKYAFPLMVIDWTKEKKDRAIYGIDIQSRMPLP